MTPDLVSLEKKASQPDSDRSEDDLWFWCVISQIILKKERNPADIGEVWENLIMINADSVTSAYEKAMKLGAQLGGDSRGSMRWNGRPAESIFLGVKDMGLIHDDIGDGCEILYRSRRQTLRKAKAAIVSRDSLTEVEEEVARRKRAIRYVNEKGREQA